MEYSPWAKINKSPKEKHELINAPVEKPSIEARSMSGKSLGKHLKTKESRKNEANEKAYADVEKKHGKDVTSKLKKWHEANERGDFDGIKGGGSIKKKHPNW